MSVLDRQTYKIFRKIMKYGHIQPDTHSVYADNGEPAPTVFLTNQRMEFAPGEIPFMESKKMPLKDPFRELSWFYIHKSNDVRLLREVLKCNVWNEWEEKDPSSEHYGTIGHAYGFIIAQQYRKYPVDKLRLDLLDQKNISKVTDSEKDGFVMLDQLDYLMQELVNNPYSRYHIISLWIVPELDNMKLKPCVWTINFQVIPSGELEITLTIRSNDLALGNPYNMIQYKYFQEAIANVTGYKVGKMTVDIHNAHYYNRHLELTKKQFDDYDILNEDVSLDPTLEVNHHDNFYDYVAEDFTIHKNERIVRGKVWEAPRIKFPLSIS